MFGGGAGLIGGLRFTGGGRFGTPFEGIAGPGLVPKGPLVNGPLVNGPGKMLVRFVGNSVRTKFVNPCWFVRAGGRLEMNETKAIL